MTDNNKKSLYDNEDHDLLIERHTIAVLVDNESGALQRVIGLFSARGYNIETLTVSEVDQEKKISRITIITHTSNRVIEHVIALLERLVPVHEVHNLTLQSPHIERSVALVKVVTEDSDHRVRAQQLADRFGARTIDSTKESFIFELSDMPEKLDKFIDLMRPFGLAEITRTGVTAMSRGINTFKTDISY